MGMVNEFLAFIRRGNVIDLAVGVIMGAAFGKIVSSLVGDVLMPPIGYLIGGIDFSDLAIKLGEGEKAATIKYGSFLQTLMDFFIVAGCVFLMVKAVNVLYTKKEKKPTAIPPQEQLLTEIRDLLKAK